jgi:hypothetical protein
VRTYFRLQQLGPKFSSDYRCKKAQASASAFIESKETNSLINSGSCSIAPVNQQQFSQLLTVFNLV